MIWIRIHWSIAALFCVWLCIDTIDSGLRLWIAYLDSEQAEERAP